MRKRGRAVETKVGRGKRRNKIAVGAKEETGKRVIRARKREIIKWWSIHPGGNW